MEIIIPAELRAEIGAAKSRLTATPDDPNAFKNAAATAEKIIKFYQKSIPIVFADHCKDFFISRVTALEIGGQVDACNCILGYRSRAYSLSRVEPTAADVAWIMMIFDCALKGLLFLRIHQEPKL